MSTACLKARSSIFLVLLLPIYSAGAEQKEPEVTAEIRAYCWSGKPSRILLSDEISSEAPAPVGDTELVMMSEDGTGAVQLSLKAGTYSPSFKFVGSRDVVFRNKDSEVGRVRLPAGVGSYILFFVGRPTGYSVLPMPYAGASAVKDGELYIANMTDMPVGVQIGTEKRAMKPHTTAMFTVREFTDYQMPIAIYERLDDSWRAGGVRTRMAIRYDIKSFGILYQANKESRIGLTILPPLY